MLIDGCVRDMSSSDTSSMREGSLQSAWLASCNRPHCRCASSKVTNSLATSRCHMRPVTSSVTTSTVVVSYF